MWRLYWLVGRGFEGVHGKLGIGKKNIGGERLLGFCKFF